MTCLSLNFKCRDWIMDRNHSYKQIFVIHRDNSLAILAFTSNYQDFSFSEHAKQILDGNPKSFNYHMNLSSPSDIN